MDTSILESLQVFSTEKIIKAYSTSIDQTPIDLRYNLAKPKTKGALPSIYFKDTPSFRAQQNKSLVHADRITYKQPGSYAHVLSVSISHFPPSFANLMLAISKDIDTLDDSGKLKKLLETKNVVAKIVIPKHLGTINFPQMRIDRFGINVIFFSKTIYSLNREKVASMIKDRKDITPCERLSEIIEFLNRYATVKRFRPELNRITLQEGFISKTSFVTRACSELENCTQMALFPFLHCDGDLIFTFEAEILTQAPDEAGTVREEDMFQITSYLDKTKLENIEERFKDLIAQDDQIVFTKSVIQKAPEYKDASTSLLEGLSFA